jgi:predicted RNA-binding Zn-ribbon protein involved in translation (DUF1610 family)
MAISFQCPKCGKKLKAPESAAGKSSPCPGCGTTVTCPEPVYDAEVVDMTLEQPGKPAGVDPYADLDDGGAYGVVAPGPAAAAPDGRRPCPMCGEMIVANAAKCRYCGEVFDPTLKKVKSKKSKKHSAEDSDLSGGEIAIALLCSGIGCIAGIVWMIQGKPKGLKMFGLSFTMAIVWSVIRAVLTGVANNRGMGGP